jgi:hypothetical protein
MGEMDLSGSVDGWTPMPYRGDTLERSYARRGARITASNNHALGQWLAPMAGPHSDQKHSNWQRNKRDGGRDLEMSDDADDRSEGADDTASLLDATSSSEEGEKIDDASLLYRCGCSALVNSRRYRRRAVPWCFVLTLGTAGWYFILR